jgi:hypothetical protein
VQNLHHVVGEAALRHQLRALHKNEDWARRDQAIDA